MFGIFNRLKILERDVERILTLLDCQKGYHKFELTSGYDNGLASTGRYVGGKKCKHCGKFIELVELTPNKDS